MNWLPDMDLNHDKQIQSLLCYRYTIGQTGTPKLEPSQAESRLERVHLTLWGLLDTATSGPERGLQSAAMIEIGNGKWPARTRGVVQPLLRTEVRAPGVSGYIRLKRSSLNEAE